MEYRVYPYSSGRLHTAPRRRRTRRRGRHGVLSALWFAGLFSWSMIALFLFFWKAPGNPEAGMSGVPVDAGIQTAPPVLPTASPEESGIHSPHVSVPESVEPDINRSGEYDFSLPVPASDPVENSYFDDAVFIGDSRTEGLILYTGLSNATSYAYKGLMVDTAFTKPVINKDGQKVSGSMRPGGRTVRFSRTNTERSLTEYGRLTRTRQSIFRSSCRFPTRSPQPTAILQTKKLVRTTLCCGSWRRKSRCSTWTPAARWRTRTGAFRKARHPMESTLSKNTAKSGLTT